MGDAFEELGIFSIVYSYVLHTFLFNCSSPTLGYFFSEQSL